MATATATTRAELRQLARLVERMEGAAARRECPLLARLRADPANLLVLAGLPPDPWQCRVMRSDSPRKLLCCSRQSGKSTTAAALGLKEALLRPPSLVLLLSPTQRQSGELFRSGVKRLYDALGRPVATVQESALSMELANGSRIVALPGEEGSVRVYSGVALLIIDEAARVRDDLYRAVRPMLAVSRGRLVALSTPFGKRGWFFNSWEGGEGWERVRITADQCPRISPQFLAAEEAALGPRWFAQEFQCSFEADVGSVFNYDAIARTLTPGLAPLEFSA